MRTAVKRGVALCITSCMLSAAFLGCSSKKEAEVRFEVETMGREIVSSGSFSDELAKLEDGMFESAYVDVDMSLVKKECAYVGTGATAEQVVVLEAKDKEGTESLKQELREKLDYDLEQNKDYLPEEITKLKEPVLQIRGTYVIMAVSNDNKKVEEVIENIIKE